MDSPQYTNQLDERQERWFAVYTRFKREKLVYQRLQEKGIHAFLPLQNLTRQYASRKRSVQLPLISCYVFTRITKKDYVRVLETLD
ncbi:MAG: UpxY family transcription antiterminator, partial [Saprospiraceae bacterium]|nr:UpxY family transcription antiterminator [Saprospiraceae bacterium]